MTETHSLSTSNNVDNEKIHEVVTTIPEEQIERDNAAGYELYEKAQDISTEEDLEIYKRVLSKVDWRIVPLLCITYTLQFLDKLSLNYASAYSFKEDLNLVGQRYSWVAAIFNFGYLFWAIPGNYIIQRLPVAKYTGFMLFTWSIILIGHVGLSNYGGALVIRFILGMFEASISPSCMIICGSFYTIKQQPIRMCLFLSFNGVATMVGALLGFGLGHATHASIKPWKLIFLVIGLMNLVWSGIFLWLCPDSPEHAKFLTEEEKAVLIKHIASNNQGVKDKKFQKYQVVEALCDVSVLMIATVGLACGVINGGSSNFISALIKGFGFTGIQATALQLPLGAIEVVFVVVGGIVSFTIKNTRCYVLFAFCIAPLVGLIGIHTISLDHRWSLVGCAFLQFIIGGPVIMCWILLNANVSGSSKRTIANGIWFLLYAAGNIIGANIFYTNQAPKYRSGVIGLITCYCGIMVLAICIRLVLMRRNRMKNKLQNGQPEEQKEQAVLNGFLGMTDFENEGFRYSL
ncbi:Dal7 allantoate permease [Candida orthopsilosis Co 90-125]|uniref:Dal7 allantoate permease n=1 Tax=Candida orthopsilosis (strain 90-125) TaxID=1136231 RepID=H8X5A9_CANO9|nr:Dal7 allantoate permease [Candida orthopsilosis Co 90-125]CCG23202.1 Dal7 allantoate permease [Candida orthopsilosis Co 90-125]